jgi:AcrR family transcriptional regulator
MKDKYIASGRQKQKLQTRQNILETARQFLAHGTDYTLEDVAKEANISRATIYRYYSNVDLLSAEAVLDIQASTPELVYRGLKSIGVSEKLIEIQDYYNTLTLNNEAAFRKYLSIVVNDSTADGVRGGRRVETIQMALAEEHIPFSKKEAQLLVSVASVLMGVESIVVTKDICGLSDAGAKKTLQWGLEMILKGMLQK